MSRKVKVIGGYLEVEELGETEPPTTEPPPTEPPPTEPLPDPEPPPVDPPDPPENVNRRYPINDSVILLDTSQGYLPDEPWLRAQPAGTIANIVTPKSDSAVAECRLSAPGLGYFGGQCLELVYLERGRRDNGPGFFLSKYRANGTGSYHRLSGQAKYLSPPGFRANRVAFRVKFPDGFGKTNAARQPPKYPNHQNFHFGTYHATPDGDRAESNNWHFYHQMFVRFELATGWITVELNEWPSVQRSSSALPPPRPTRSAGLDYWDSLTRFYIDCPYVDHELQPPFSVLYDDIKLLNVDESDGPDGEADWDKDADGSTGWRNYTDPLVETRHRPEKGPWDRAVPSPT